MIDPVAPVAGRVRVVNPATEQAVAEVARDDEEAVDAAVRRAAAAFPAWRDVTPGDRARLLRRFAEHVEAHAEELALLETRNVGKPIADSRGEVSMVADVLHFYAGAVDKHRGATIPVAGGVDLTWHEALGVVAAIVPWNFPLVIASWKIGPALACGNTVVAKPAELTPLTALRFAELALDAGLPEGVLQVVVGRGTSVGSALVEHPDVAKVAFTGSTEAGRDVMARAAGTVKRVTLELGGKSANVVFADADLELAAASAPLAVFANAGQDCCARSRILVERSVFDRFVELLVTATQALVVGDPEDDATQMGPLVSADHRARVAAFLDPGESGLALAGRSGVPGGPGWWFPATVVAPVAPDRRVWREEIFGPVVTVTPFDDEAHAVTLANDTPYGLSGSIWTRDSGRALRMAKAVQAGVISVNSNTSVRVNTPFGGMKQSGFGRELGMEALASFSDVKNVFLSTQG
jgi:acyl-CoA reductase-like NAD-dependent aldehyde dehydrogenase